MTRRCMMTLNSTNRNYQAIEAGGGVDSDTLDAECEGDGRALC